MREWSVLDELEPDRGSESRHVYINNPTLTRREFLEMLAVSFQLSREAAGSKTHLLMELHQLLTNVSLYWFTRSGASTAHAVYDGMRAWRAFAAQQVAAAGEPGAEGSGSDSGWEAPAGPPTGVAVFAADTTIRSLLDRDGTIAHWSEFERGGHFAAMEAPDLLAGDLQAFFRPLR